MLETFNFTPLALHLSAEHLVVGLRVQSADFVQHVPSRGLGHVDVAAQLMAADAFLVAAYEIHRHEPFDERDLCVLENRANETGEVLSALWAAETVVVACFAVVATAIGANDVSVRPT